MNSQPTINAPATEGRLFHPLFRRVAIIGYSAMAIFTFGHAWHQDYTRCVDGQTGGAIIASPFCAAFWPLYWSVKIQQPNPELRDAAPTQPQTLSTHE